VNPHRWALSDQLLGKRADEPENATVVQSPIF
jgi:hypothetical protein